MSLAVIPTLATERLVLRAPCAADAAPLAAFYAGPRSGFVGGPLPDWAVWRYLAEVIGHWSLRGYGRWIAEERATGAAIGLVGLHHPLDWPEPEIGWILFDGAEGRGLAREAALAARAHAYGTLGWRTVISLVDPGNVRSAGLAAAMGAVRDGSFAHPKYGAMDIWRHPAPSALPGGTPAARPAREVTA